MADIDEIKQIIAPFLRVEPEEINETTRIDRKSMPGSVLYFRMCSKLKVYGLREDDFVSIYSFGDLVSVIEGGRPMPRLSELAPVMPQEATTSMPGIGIDLERNDQFKAVTDYWTNDFFTSVFSDEEIAYCSVAKDPSQSFAGLFAAKEAIIKADPGYVSKSLKDISINHNEFGKPVFQGFHLSITHVEEYAAAVALRHDGGGLKNNDIDLHTQKSETEQKTSKPRRVSSTIVFMLISFSALILSLLAVWQVYFSPGTPGH